MQKGKFYQGVSQAKIVCTQVFLFAFDLNYSMLVNFFQFNLHYHIERKIKMKFL